MGRRSRRAIREWNDRTSSSGSRRWACRESGARFGDLGGCMRAVRVSSRRPGDDQAATRSGAGAVRSRGIRHRPERRGSDASSGGRGPAEASLSLGTDVRRLPGTSRSLPLSGADAVRAVTRSARVLPQHSLQSAEEPSSSRLRPPADGRLRPGSARPRSGSARRVRGRPHDRSSALRLAVGRRELRQRSDQFVDAL